ncbi:MAG: tetratricopeptide repeat protein [Hydrogenophaga sp.]|uniref:tetratricopeptide repeat protein n=1 Tax=Hydrogenophaga sp. TaxID=1904254 RepID=UPI002602E04B|nr:tetratricopeptide repeat protein [Hydrogenophaga sp.]MDM7943566.1 tetratricopeptide repeat protein [Hydrogenophaga sp.]
MNPAAVALAPSPGSAAFNAGNNAWREHHAEVALAHYVGACTLDPVLVHAHLGRARCLVKLQRWMDAREAFADVLRLDTSHYSAWLEAGHLCRQMGELQQAAGAYQRAIDAAPARYEAYLGMARVLEQIGQLTLGAAAYEQAQRAALGDGSTDAAALQRLREVHQLMARYRLERGAPEAAVPSLRAALVTAEREGEGAGEDVRAEIRMDLGDALLRLGQRDAALQVLTLASAATAEATLSRLGALSFRFNLWQEGLAVLRRNVALHPTSVQARWNLAHMLAECWHMEEAEQVLQQAEALGPVSGATAMRASVAGRQGDAQTALRLYRELAEHDASYASSAAMSSLYSDRLGAREVAELHHQLFAPLGQGARARESFKRLALSGRRLRLGVVSADFHHQHPVNLFMQPMLREWDRTRIELFVYFTGVSHDEQTQLARQRAEHWVEATALNDAQLAKRIDADAIDVLLDLAGHTGQQRMRLFAQRAAPVQVTYLGYPGSTGVPNMDWMIGDAVVTPEPDDALCSERVWRLPGLVFCYAPEVDYPYPAYDDVLAQRPLTFGSFNNVPKLTQRTLTLWARVLLAVPGSRLLLKAPSFSDAGAVRLFGERLLKLGVDPARLEFRGPTGLTDMMAEYADVDIALDPVPYNGGTTSLQALWMGVPVITLEGEHFVSRMGASFMRAAHLPDWVASDDEHYLHIAVRMAADRTALLQLKRGLRAQLQARPGWDPVAHTRAMEDAFCQMASSR